MNTSKKDFETSFSMENLLRIYKEEISNSKATGVDNISTRVFERNLSDNISKAKEKVINGDYRFTRYKQKLISKGENKYPREVCIPTIRDRIILKALNGFLQKRLSEKVEQPLPQKITKNIKSSIKQETYDWVIKLDVADFYPSIKHDLLIQNVRRFIKDERVINLVSHAIKQSTKKSNFNDRGIPQGLPISNILAALYLRNLDTYFSTRHDFIYQRYVDDILIICKHESSVDISKKIINRCKKIGLQVYDPIQRPDKSSSNSIKSEFSYLGYRYNPKENKYSLASTSKASKQKLIDSLVGLFTAYHTSQNKSLALLQWRVNLRITGCVSENKGKGWIFFFSEIDDKKSLFELDNIVLSLFKRFNVKFPLKKFVRSWYEINHNRWRNKYFPNFDRYDLQEMASIVSTYQRTSPNELNLTKEQIKYQFWNIIKKEIKEMDSDIQPFS